MVRIATKPKSSARANVAAVAKADSKRGSKGTPSLVMLAMASLRRGERETGL